MDEEWLLRPVLKTGRLQGLVGSTPTLSATTRSRGPTATTPALHAGDECSIHSGITQLSRYDKLAKRLRLKRSECEFESRPGHYGEVGKRQSRLS